MDLYRKPVFLSFLWCLYIFVTVCARSDDGFAQYVKTGGLIKDPHQTAQPLQPDQSTKPAQSNQLSQQTQPNQPSQPDQSAQLNQPAQPNQTTQPNEPAQPAQPAKPAQPNESAQPAPSAKPAQPNEPAQPGQPDQPNQPSSSSPSSPTNFRTPKTPPPPPMKYTEGEPQIMKDFFEQTFGDQRLQFFDNGTAQLSLDQYSGSGFKSKSEYIYLTMTMQIKLIPNDSAGAVTTFYLTSSGFGHDEIDIEFLGNATGQPPTMHTNVYVDGKGNREQQFHLWFDPTAEFHTYTLSWNSKRIAWFVDGIPIRQYKSDRPNGVPYPTNKAQRIISSLWNADDWCTQGGRVKADWSKAPFVAHYKDFKSGFCEWKNDASTCGVTPTSTEPKFAWLNEEFDEKGLEMIKWAQDNLMIYNYCNDKGRFPDGLPKECTLFP